ncbi:MAG: transcription elongation factor GreA [Parasporobacterium sp.]|nr:transcription elongation factor GreA [Parasporobacterium sp.]
MEEKRILTKESLAKLHQELDDLTINKRREIAAKIKEAREQGDLSENAEYDAAKDEQRDIEARIEELNEIIKNSEVLDESTINFNKVHLGCILTLKDLNNGRETVYQIVSETDVNSRERKISQKSPIGEAATGREIGDVIEINVPAGTFTYRIINIESGK